MQYHQRKISSNGNTVHNYHTDSLFRAPFSAALDEREKNSFNSDFVDIYPAISPSRYMDIDDSESDQMTEYLQSEYDESDPRYGNDISARLIHQGDIYRAKLKQLKEIREQLEEQSLKKAPEICEKSRELVQMNPVLNQSFLKRQEIYQKISSIGKENEPPVNKANSKLSKEDMIRLSIQDSERLKKSREKLAEKYYSKYTFRPMINPRSKQLATSSGGFEELYKNKRAEEKRRVLEEKVRSEEMQECTFHPNISNITNISTLSSISSEYASEAISLDENHDFSVVSNSTFMSLEDRLSERHQRHQEELEKLRIQLEEKEFRECTFEPQIASRSTFFKLKANDDGADLSSKIPGFNQYLERKQKSNDIIKEKQEREAKVFLTNASNKLPLTHQQTKKSITVPKPFRLLTNLNSRHDISYLE